jgi:predicted small lipoprotein YifL
MNPFSRLVSSGVCLVALTLFSLTGCGQGSPGPRPQSDVEQVSLHIENVPAEVACLRITASGASRQVVRDLDVIEGQSVSESFSGLPIGAVVFQAAAYAQTCDSVTKSTVPTWVSEPISVTVSLSQSKSVSLTLYRNGRAKVTVGFDPEAADGGSVDGG